MACSYFLPRLIGAGRAYEFMLTGNFMTANEAMNLGLCSRMVESEQLLETALELARTMNDKNPMGLRLTKEAINVNLDTGGLEQALQMEDRNQMLLVLRGMVDKKEENKPLFLKTKRHVFFTQRRKAAKNRERFTNSLVRGSVNGGNVR